MLRQNTPGSSRTDTRPRDDTVTRPTRLDADTPERDRFNHEPRPIRRRFRTIKPTR